MLAPQSANAPVVPALGIEKVVKDLTDGPGVAGVLDLFAHVPDQQPEGVERRFAAADQVSGLVKGHLLLSLRATDPCPLGPLPTAAASPPGSTSPQGGEAREARADVGLR